MKTVLLSKLVCPNKGRSPRSANDARRRMMQRMRKREPGFRNDCSGLGGNHARCSNKIKMPEVKRLKAVLAETWSGLFICFWLLFIPIPGQFLLPFLLPNLTVTSVFHVVPFLLTDRSSRCHCLLLDHSGRLERVMTFLFFSVSISIFHFPFFRSCAVIFVSS